jgi:TRAP-type C4-dicarboxylate transport system permease small subunit
MFIKYLERLQLTVGGLCLTIFFITILVQITSRHTGISLIWTEEVATYSFIWAVFMGAAVMVNRREHFNFDYILKKLKGESRIYLRIVNDLILMGFNIALFYYGVMVVESFWNYNWASLPMMKMGYVWISLPIMSLTMFIYSLAHLLRSVRELTAKEVSE